MFQILQGPLLTKPSVIIDVFVAYRNVFRAAHNKPALNVTSCRGLQMIFFFFYHIYFIKYG